MRRRGLLALPALLAGCSVLPDRPFVATNFHTLAPERPGAPAARADRPALLLRSLGNAPGLESRGLRRVRPDGTLDIAFYEQWLAPPPELAEAALRAWLIAGRHFAAVAAPGTRSRTPLILEAELTALEALPGEGVARAGLGALLLRDGEGLAEAQVVGQRLFSATAPIAAGPPEAIGQAQAAAMQAALGAVFAELEAWLLARVPVARPR
ncbi:MAG: ABC-type transport auxiliary lipoprotein family protein [Rubritepida sp.]|jgi:ABC-type uncharacterized transport system auxiliary subunit|nr:ABC-type transport auxiliary lipoprotein family protein [Rubritepida sp.]